MTLRIFAGVGEERNDARSIAAPGLTNWRVLSNTRVSSLTPMPDKRYLRRLIDQACAQALCENVGRHKAIALMIERLRALI
jgi:hypothetical protein